MKQTMTTSHITLKTILLRKINDFENGIELFKKMQYREMKLEDAKELQNIFKSNLKKISKGRFKIQKILNSFTNHDKLLLNYIMIILQLNLKLKTKQNKEKD